MDRFQWEVCVTPALCQSLLIPGSFLLLFHLTGWVFFVVVVICLHLTTISFDIYILQAVGELFKLYKKVSIYYEMHDSIYRFIEIINQGLNVITLFSFCNCMGSRLRVLLPCTRCSTVPRGVFSKNSHLWNLLISKLNNFYF